MHWIQVAKLFMGYNIIVYYDEIIIYLFIYLVTRRLYNKKILPSHRILFSTIPREQCRLVCPLLIWVANAILRTVIYMNFQLVTK